MSTVFLLLILLGLVVCAYRFLGHDIVNPTVLLGLPLAVAVFLGLTCYQQWKFELHWKTVLLISGAVFSFFVGNLIVYYLYGRYLNASQKQDSAGVVSQSLVVQKWHRFVHYLSQQGGKQKFQIITYLLLLVFQIATYSLTLQHIFHVVSSYHGEIMVDRTNALGVYDQLTKFSNIDTSLPAMLNIGMLFCETMGFPLIYLFAKRLTEVNGNSRLKLLLTPISLLIIANVVLSAGGPLLTGGKAGTIWFILGSLVIIYMTLANASGQREKSLTWKSMLLIVAVLSALVVLTLILVIVVGRNITGYNGPLGYLLIYLAGGIKNLDIFVSNQHMSSGYFGIQTFKSIYQRLGVSIPDVGLEEYHHIGNTWFGNVYTAFADPYFDFGICGTFIAMILLGLLFEYLFLHTYNNLNADRLLIIPTNALDVAGDSAQEYGRQTRMKSWSPRVTAFSILVYGYLIRALFFAFFSNILFTSIFSFGFFIRCVIWLFFVELFIPSSGDPALQQNCEGMRNKE